jgi:hypothetical protein
MNKLEIALMVLASLAAAAIARAEREPGRAGGDRGSQRPSDSASRMDKPFWIDTGVGWQRVGFTTVHVRRSADGDPLTADLVPDVASGPMAHVGVGGRIRYFTLGIDGSVSFLEGVSSRSADGSLQLYSIDAQLGLRFPFARVEPYLQLAVGYSVFGGLGDAIQGLGRGLDVDGANARIALGLDYFVSPNVAIGARSTFEFFFLARRGQSVRDLSTAQSVNTIGEARARLLQGDGSSIGSAFGVTIGPSLHF